MSEVSVLIPAYRAGAFIGRTLDSVRAQSHQRLRVLISIDGRDEATQAVCQAAADADPRFEVEVQDEPLGWLGNTNLLIGRARSEFFFILPHDDTIAPDYVAALLQEAQAHPDAVIVYCDVECFGLSGEVRSTPGLDGPFAERAAALLAAPNEGVAWRGLVRRSLAAGALMPDNAYDGFQSHVAWLLELLCRGPFRLVPRALYRRWRRDDPDSVTTRWRGWPAERLYAGLAEHTVQCMRIVAASGEADPQARHRLVLLLLMRLLAHPYAARAARSAGAQGVDTALARASELVGAALGLPLLDDAGRQGLRADPVLAPFVDRLHAASAA